MLGRYHDGDNELEGYGVSIRKLLGGANKIFDKKNWIDSIHAWIQGPKCLPKINDTNDECYLNADNDYALYPGGRPNGPPLSIIWRQIYIGKILTTDIQSATNNKCMTVNFNTSLFGLLQEDCGQLNQKFRLIPTGIYDPHSHEYYQIY